MTISVNNGFSTIASEIQEIRSRICNSFLITMAIITIPALAASLYRITFIGWQSVMALHIFIAFMIFCSAILRNKIPYNYKAAIIIIIFLAIGLGGILQFGLLAAGTVFIVTSSPLATLLFGIRVGIVTLLLTLAIAAQIGILTVSGNLLHTVDAATYVIASSSWINAIIGWGLAASALTVSLHIFNNNLINALITSAQHQKELVNQQEKLKKIIEERNYTNRELKIALDEIKILKGIIPICSYCHNIRDEEGAWERLETYLSTHSDAQFSHGICPKCMPKVMADAGLGENKKQ